MNDEHSIDAPAPDQFALIDAAWQQVEQARSTQATIAAEAGAKLLRELDAGAVELVADAIPGYRIQDEIHRGGQGAVYRALQNSTGRMVAIKVMHAGLFAGARERIRFEREVQILAALKHPNIVTIHDSGAAGDNTYFVMDYIEGLPLDQHVQQKKLGTEDRLRLFAKICAAVNVAHLRGVIHRDLKPGNIRIDEKHEPHVLDFGLAKQADWESADANFHDTVTVSGQFIGSLPWASPEQAEGRIDQTDLRTDVYALGVMLYQLLTGRFPYDVSASLTMTAYNIIHTAPKNPRSLNPRINDEVTTIVLKALHKEREMRYQSAGALGKDIERYLADEPIEAKRDSVSYVLRKQIARHKVFVGFGVALLLLVTIGFVVSVSFWRQAVVARDAMTVQKGLALEAEKLAVLRAEDATKEASKAEAVSNFLTDMLASASPLHDAAPDITVREAIDEAAQRLDEGALEDQPEVEAVVRRTVGATYGALGLYPEASHHLSIARNLFSAIPEKYQKDAIVCAFEQAGALRSAGQLDEAEALFNETLSQARKHLGETHPRVARVLIGLASIMRDREKPEEAVRISRDALAILRVAEPADDDATAVALNDLGVTQRQLREFKDAQKSMEEALAIARKLNGREHLDVAVTISNLAGVCTSLRDLERAEALYLEALDIYRKVTDDDHPYIASTLGSLSQLCLVKREFDRAHAYQLESLNLRRRIFGDKHPLVANSLNNHGIVLYQLNDWSGAADAWREALEIFKITRGPKHPSLAQVMSNLAAVLHIQGDTDAAIPILRDVLTIREAHHGLNHMQTGLARYNVGRALLDAKRFDEAEPLIRSALAIQRKVYTEDHFSVAHTLGALAEIRRLTGDLFEAEAFARDALATIKRYYTKDHPDVAAAINQLAHILEDKEAFTKAEALRNEAIRITDATRPAEHWERAVMRARRGRLFLKMRRFDDAETELLASHQSLTDTLGPKHPKTREAVDSLEALYDQLGRPDDARYWRAELEPSN